MSNAVVPRSRPPAETLEVPFLRILRTQLQVIHALMLHDIKSRFFGSGLGYILTILWPSAHILIIVLIYYVTKKPAPYGSDRLLYIAMGVLPYIIWNYISRFTMLGLMMNRTFLSYPVVRLLDMIVARQMLEIVSCTIITVGLMLILTLFGSEVIPPHPDVAACAFMATVLLGVGFGVFNGILAMIFPLWNIGYVGILILAWATSGVSFDVETAPTQIGDILAWNPLLGCVEWMRTAYYDDFPARLLDKTYVIEVGFVALTLGLIMERTLRRVIFR